MRYIIRVFTIGLSCLLLCSGSLYAQKTEQQGGGIVYPGDNPFGYDPSRSFLHSFLSQFWLSVSTGHYRTSYAHDLTDYAVLRKNDTVYIIPQAALNPTGGNVGIRNWYTMPVPDSVNINAGTDSLVTSDTTLIQYTGAGRGTPVDINLRFDYQRFRIGAGISFEFHKFKNASPDAHGDILGEWRPEPRKTTIRRIYLLLGYDILDYRLYGLAGDLRVAILNMGRGFDQSLMEQSIALNLGLSYERKFSEIFRVFVRGGYEFKSYTMNLPPGALSVRNASWTLNVGASFSFPHLPRCPVKKCTTQIDHAHAGNAYRSRMHPFWKWQNPHYGENNPTLIPYKRKNRRKMWAY